MYKDDNPKIRIKNIISNLICVQPNFKGIYILITV